MTLGELQNILVTGGAGFVGTALIPVLLDKNYRVMVIDHLNTSKLKSLERFFPLDNFEFIKLDLLDENKLKEIVKENDLIFHLAANVDVRKGHLNTNVDFLNNIVATRNVLEAMRASDRCKKIIFTSSSVVYGEALQIPTPEIHGPLTPISLYGASKLACEALISGYTGSFGINAVIFRLANIIGPTIEHGVIFDFFNKLKQSKGNHLQILGDGNQTKSYLYIDDCINALLIGMRKFSSALEIFNVGSDDQINTNTIAKIIIDELRLNPEIIHLNDSNNGRGWTGDVKYMLLSTEKLKKIGWKINYSSEEAVRLTARNIASHGYD